MSAIFTELGIIMVIAGVVAYLARTFRQPLIPAYIIAGIILGPLFGLVTDKETIVALSELGIAFLLFTAGLELNLKKIKQVGSSAVIGALVNIIVMFSLGFGIFTLLKFETMTAVYAGLVLIFSSTLVVIKLMSDKRELETLHGRIILGVLLVQDLVVIIVLSVLHSTGDNLIKSLGNTFGQGIIVLIAGYFIAKITFNRVFKFAARNDELLFVLTMTILFAFSLIFMKIGFSVAIGGFVAGVLLGQLPYKYEMIGQTKMLKEFFAVLFFVSVGLAFTPVSVLAIALPFFVLLALIFLGIPTVLILALSMLGFKKRTAFLSAVTLSQVSEFSLILVSIGVAKNHIPPEFYNIVILLALVTMTITTYVIKYDEKIYGWVGRRMDFLEKLAIKQQGMYGYESNVKEPKIVMFGYDRTGYSIFKKLKQMKKSSVIVDINPEIIKRLAKEEVPCMYGDVGDMEILERLHLDKVETVISTIPNHNETMLLIDEVRKLNPAATIIVTSYEAEEAMVLYDAGADYVIIPHFLGGEHLSVILDQLTGSIGRRLKIKVSHLKSLKQRQKHAKARQSL